MLTVGLDVHQSRTSVCVLDGKGNPLKQQEVKGGLEAVVAALKALPEPFQVCYEASTGYGVWYEALAPLAARVEVAHPGRLKLIYASKKKHNRGDAQKLAALLHLDQVPAVHVPLREVRAWRGLIEHRLSMGRRVVAVKNQIRALLRHCGIKGLPGPRQWSPAGRQWLLEQVWPTPVEGCRLRALLEELAGIEAVRQELTAELDRMGKGHPGVQLLQSVPGIGPRTAEAFVAYVDDPHRFSSRSIGAYFGLVPREDSTGTHRRLGHITQEGPASVRMLLCEAVWRAVRVSKHMAAVLERYSGGRKERRKIGVVATAHHLARLMLAMLKSGEAYRESGGESGGQPGGQAPAGDRGGGASGGDAPGGVREGDAGGDAKEVSG